METKQTAVEWLYQQLYDTPKDKLNWYAIFNKAIKLEQSQLIECFNEADADAYRKDPKYKTALDYITATYEH